MTTRGAFSSTVFASDKLTIAGDLSHSLVYVGVTSPERAAKLASELINHTHSVLLEEFACATLTGLRERLRNDRVTIGAADIVPTERLAFIRAQCAIRPTLYALASKRPDLIPELAAHEHRLGATLLVNTPTLDPSLPSAKHILSRAERLALKGNDYILASNAAHHRAMSCSVSRDLARARSGFFRAIDLLDAASDPSGALLRVPILYDLAETLARSGYQREATAKIELAQAMSGNMNSIHRWLHVQHNAALVALFAGRFAEASELFLDVEQRCDNERFLCASCAKYAAISAFCAGEFRLSDEALSRAIATAKALSYGIHLNDLKRFVSRHERYYQVRHWTRLAN